MLSKSTDTRTETDGVAYQSRLEAENRDLSEKLHELRNQLTVTKTALELIAQMVEEYEPRDDQEGDFIGTILEIFQETGLRF